MKFFTNSTFNVFKTYLYTIFCQNMKIGENYFLSDFGLYLIKCMLRHMPAFGQMGHICAVPSLLAHVFYGVRYSLFSTALVFLCFPSLKLCM